MQPHTKALGLIMLFAGSCDLLQSPEHEATDCTSATQLVVSNENPLAMEPGEAAAGVERCDEHTWNSTSATTCSVETRMPACAPGDEEVNCRTDSDCGGSATCLRSAYGCQCFETCETDSDCPSGSACICSAGVSLNSDESFQLYELPQCVPADCRSADDCAGSPCGIELSVGCLLPLGLRCRAPESECISDADCAGRDHCALEDNQWRCSDQFATCE